MVRIAVAGGLGDVGRTIVEVLGQNPQNHVFTLSRKPAENLSTLYINYDNVSELHGILEKNGIQVVISCLSVNDPTVSMAETNLVRASQLSSRTTRFIASQWSITALPGGPLPDFSAATIAELEKTDLEHTTVSNGHFSDYYGYPKVKSYLRHADFLLDITNKAAAIPGSGNDNVTFTYSFDVARFVDALVSTSRPWPRHSTIIRDKITLNELLHTAEEARGAKFSLTYDDPAKLKALQVTELPSQVDAYRFFPKPILQTMFAVINQWILEGRFDLCYEGSLNEMFPHIKTKSTKDLIYEAWK